LNAALIAAAEPGATLDTRAAAALTVALADVQVRDVLLAQAVREHRLDEFVDALSPLLRAVDAADVPAVAATLGAAAYLAGHGALAWVAVDRAQRVDPAQPLAALVAHCLSEGLPPDRLRESITGLPTVAQWSGAPLGTAAVANARRTEEADVAPPAAADGDRAG
jgi:hypothetical protein